jgi:hypothetical protein
MKKQKIFFILLSGLLFSACQDSPVESEEQFVKIYFKYGFRNELNTFAKTFQKDLIMDGVIKVEFWLTADEQNNILEKANALNYFAMPDTFKYISQDSINVSIDPDPGEQILRIQYRLLDKTIVWTYPPVENNSQFNDLLELQKFIITIIESKPEYKQLPAARGGYM